jgi:hypothetical protein
MSASCEFLGVQELKQNLYSLEKKIGRRILAKGERAGGKVYLREAQARYPRASGQSADSLKLVAGKRSTVTVTYKVILQNPQLVKLTKNWKRYFIPAAVEYGHKQGNHFVPPQAPLRLSFETKKFESLAVTLGVFKDELEKAVAER